MLPVASDSGATVSAFARPTIPLLAASADGLLLTFNCPSLHRYLADRYIPVATERGGSVIHAATVPVARMHGAPLVVPEGSVAESVLAEARRSLTPSLRLAGSEYPWGDYFEAAKKPKPYQCGAMDAVWVRAVMYGWGALLADEVGLGKTLISLGVLSRLKAEGKLSVARPGIVVAPASVALQWLDEARVALRSPINMLVVQGSAAQKATRLTEPAEVYVLTWDLLILHRYSTLVHAIVSRASAVVLDESSRIKNPAAKTSRVAHRLFAGVPVRWALNATPLETRAEDLWSQFRVLDQRLLGPLTLFRKRYIVTIPTQYGEKVVGHRHLKELRVRTSPVVFRRIRSEVGHDLPVKAVVRHVVLGPLQVDAYRRAVGEFLADSSPAVAGTRIAGVQRAAWSADILDPRSPSAKADELLSLLESDFADDRLVLFSRLSTIVMDAAARLRASTDRRVLTITGKDSPADRAYARRVFEGTDRAVIVATAAAERGLNLQAAPAVIHLDLPWTYASLRQRVGRVARIGQAANEVWSLTLAARLDPSRPAMDDWIVGLLERRKTESREAVGEDSSDDLGLADIAALRRFLSDT